MRLRLHKKYILFAQGIYTVLTSVWPILHIKSFLMVTGPKTDIWLVKTMGGVLSAIGVVLLYCAFKNQLSRAVLLLAIGHALVLMISDIHYYSANIISPVYLADAFVQIVMVSLWLVFIWGHNKQKAPHRGF
jgi:hypothetical protein